MKKRFMLFLTSLLVVSSVVGCSSSDSIGKSDKPATTVKIEGKGDSDLTGLTYLYDYGNNARLYADNFTKIVYIVYFDESGSGAKATKAVAMAPWISEDGNYYYIDTENRTIKELTDDNNASDDTSSDKDTSDTSDESDTSGSTSEESDSSTLDSSVTDKINQNQN